MNFAPDKIKHLIAGAIISLIVMGLGYHFDAKYYSAYGIFAAWVIGWAKEFIWDAAHPEDTVDFYDMVATGAGGIIAVVTWKLGYLLITAFLMQPLQAETIDYSLLENRYIIPANGEVVARLNDGSIRRRFTVLKAYQSIHPCPSTGLATGRCPNWEMNPVIPLECGGRDAVSNMQWLRTELKTCPISSDRICVDRYERRINAANPKIPDTANCVNSLVQ